MTDSSTIENRLFAKRLKATGFGVQQTFKQFDFRFNEDPLPASTLRDPATCHFVEQHRNIVIRDPPGVGRTHAAIAIGQQCRAGYQVRFRPIRRLLSDLCADSAERAERELRYAIKVDLLILNDFACGKYAMIAGLRAIGH